MSKILTIISKMGASRMSQVKLMKAKGLTLRDSTIYNMPPGSGILEEKQSSLLEKNKARTKN